MVARLVEHEQLRLGKQCLRQRKDILLAARELLNWLVAAITEAESVEHALGSRGKHVAARALIRDVSLVICSGGRI